MKNEKKSQGMKGRKTEKSKAMASEKSKGTRAKPKK